MAKEFEWKERIDYKETIVPVIKWVTIRAIISIAAQKDYELCHIDIKTTFLYRNLKEKVYATQPQGFEIHGKEQMIYKFQKILYGLR